MGTRIGETGPVFGTTDQTWGYISNLTEKTSTNTNELQNGAGKIVAVETDLGTKTEVSGEYVYRASGGADSASVGSGTAIDVSGSAPIHITEVSSTISNAEWKKATFTGFIYPDLDDESSS